MVVGDRYAPAVLGLHMPVVREPLEERCPVCPGGAQALGSAGQHLNRESTGRQDVDALPGVRIRQVDHGPGCHASAATKEQVHRPASRGRDLLRALGVPPLLASHLQDLLLAGHGKGGLQLLGRHGGHDLLDRSTHDHSVYLVDEVSITKSVLDRGCRSAMVDPDSSQATRLPDLLITRGAQGGSGPGVINEEE